MTIGVLALQGAFRAHIETLAALGVDAIEVRRPQQLDAVDALVMPGGESTTMSKLLDSAELFDPIANRLDDGMAVFGTCAGMILLADVIEDGRADQRSFGRLAISVKRNGYGRQIDSFETSVDVAGLESPVHAVFIRAPRIVTSSADVEVLARVEDDAVLVRNGTAMAASFHPELSDDDRIHRLFLENVAY